VLKRGTQKSQSEWEWDNVETYDLGALTIDKAKPLIGTVFEVALSDGRTTTLKLDDVVSYEPPHRRRSRTGVTPKREPFALYFLGPPGEILPQGLFSLRSESGAFEEIFMVPIGQDEIATEYEAVFT